MKNSIRILWYMILISLLTILDQYTKIIAVDSLKDKKSVTFIPKVISFSYLENQGAAWGMLFGKQLLLGITTTVACIAIVYVFFKVERNLRNKTEGCWKLLLLEHMLVILLSGAIGNAIDRARQQYVIDFIELKFIDFPIFNVADCYVTVSVFVILMLFIFCLKESEIEEIFKKNSN